METIRTTKQFEEIYRKLYYRLFLYASDFVGDAEVSRDIVADVFASLWINRASIDIAGIEAYLRSSVRNSSLNYMRHQKTHEKYSEYFRLVEQEAETLDSIDTRESELLKAISLLPEKTRFILNQTYLYDKTYEEVALITGLTTDGVKYHISKAYSFLRDYFSKERDV